MLWEFIRTNRWLFEPSTPSCSQSLNQEHTAKCQRIHFASRFRRVAAPKRLLCIFFIWKGFPTQIFTLRSYLMDCVICFHLMGFYNVTQYLAQEPFAGNRCWGIINEIDVARGRTFNSGERILRNQFCRDICPFHCQRIEFLANKFCWISGDTLPAKFMKV